MAECRVWAPRAQQVELVLLPDGERLTLQAQARGYFSTSHPRVAPGQRYAFSLDGGDALPDPRSALQPDGVHGPSCWVDFNDFAWTDEGFQQVPLSSAVIYELHVGTFSAAGTFDGVIEHLPALRQLGVTHIELMPVAHFPGQRGWGYDGVCLFAPHTAYGGPEGLCRLVNTAHRLGIAVILDVVYNHLGPSGNYLGHFGPYFTDHYKTPWGEALNFDGRGSDAVRDFVCDNALHWISNYHIDGLRLDAVHAIFDQSATHILAELVQRVDRLSSALGRHLVLIAESGLNDARVVRERAVGGHGLDGQWSDDFHHALHCVLTGERSGYYADYGAVEHLASALRHGFVYRGQYSECRERSFGGSTEDLEGRRFVVFAQNHDQVGNRATGDRLSATLDSGPLKIAAALTLLAPFVPLIFMGEEWATQRPFQYFTDHSEPELAQAVREGRRREFAAFGWRPEQVPDPQAAETFERSRLDRREATNSVNQEMLAWYRSLLALRRKHPTLSDDRLSATRVGFSEREGWLTMQRGNVIAACNFSTQQTELEVESTDQLELLLKSDSGVRKSDRSVSLPPHSVAVLSTSPGDA